MPSIMNTFETTPAQTGRMKELNQIGFQRVGKSNLYKNGPAVVDTHKDGSFDILVDYDDHIHWQDIIGIKVGHGYNSFGLVILSNDGVAIERTRNGSGGGMHRGAPTLAEFQGRAMVEQLRDAGFIRDELDEHIYRQHVKEDKENFEIIAMVQGGRIEKILKPLRDSVRARLTPQTQILGCSSTKAEYGSYMVSTYTLQDDTMQYQLSDQYDGWLVEGSQRILRNVTLEALGINRIEVAIEPSGFKIGGVNETKLILGLPRLAGQSIEKLEARMRPDHDSGVGFLGPNESLLRVMAKDNDFVTGKGLTHQELAQPLLYAREHHRKGYGSDFTLKGRKFHAEVIAYRGMQFSPFDDKTGTNVDMTVTNLDTGASLECSGLLPDMIMRYGFYEGEQTSYRLEPGAIIEVFDFLKV